MKKIFVISILSLLSIIPLNFSQAASFPVKLKGMILLQAESRGQLWYIDPVTQERYYFNDATGLFRIVKAVGLGINNKNFDSLAKFASKFAGRILIKVEDKGRAYYIVPGSLKIISLGRPDEIFKILAGLSIGVTDKIIDQIKLNKNFPETARVIDENATGAPIPEPPASDQSGTSTTTDTQTATTTPATPTTATTTTETATSSQACRFSAQYFENKFLYEPLATTTEIDRINFDWGMGSPEGVTVMNKFSARWTANCYFAAGTYRFTAVFDDAMSINVDNDNIIRSWTDNDHKRTFTVDKEMTEGWHDIKIEYYEYYNNALAQFSWGLLQ